MPELDIVIGTKTADKQSGVKSSDFDLPGNGGSATTVSNPVQNMAQGQGLSIMRSVYASRIVSSLEQSAKSMFNFAKSNYGNFTGDYLKQAKIDAVFSNASVVLGVAGSLGSGFAVGGVPGLAVAAVTESISIGTQAFQSNVTYNLQNSKTNAQANFNAARLGNIIVGGNR